MKRPALNPAPEPAILPGSPNVVEPMLPVAARQTEVCWNLSGIYGDRTCSKLASVVHCRDCPIFAEALPQLLNRPSSAEYREEWTAHYAKAKGPTTGANSSAILFRLGEEWFGLPTQVVQEVTELRPIHSIPHRPPGLLLGLANVRGELLTCVSVGHLLGARGSGNPDRSRKPGRLVVIVLGRERYAFPADEVHGVFRFHSLGLRQPPATGPGPAAGCTQGILDWAERRVGLLNAESVFTALGGCIA